MARNYGVNSEVAEAARETMQHESDVLLRRKLLIERGLLVVAIALSVISILFNVIRSINSVRSQSVYTLEKEQADARLAELKSKLQDPTAQNYVYVDPPIIRNMTDKGQDIARLQNELIAFEQQALSIDSGNNGSMQTIPGSTNVSMVSGSEDHETSDNESGSGPITLEPDDSSVDTTETIDASTIDSSETNITLSDTTTDDNLDENSVSNNSSTGASNDESINIDTSVENSSSIEDITSNEVSAGVNSQDWYEKENAFKEYSPSPIENVDGNGIPWSWYGEWVFEGTYDVANTENNPVTYINAIWVCYNASDVNHASPLGFVTATYDLSTDSFSNFVAVYTKNYVPLSVGQRSILNHSRTDGDSDGSPRSTEGDSTLSPDESNSEDSSDDSGEDSETEDMSSADASSLSSDEEVDSYEDTTPASNPNGNASWRPGVSNGGQTPQQSGSGVWNPSGGNASSGGTWIPGGYGQSNGIWTPGVSGDEFWSPSNNFSNNNAWQPEN